MKLLTLVTLLTVQLASANSLTGMPSNAPVTKKSFETLECHTQDYKILLQLSQARESDEQGVIQIWSRSYQNAKYPDVFEGNFDVKQALKDREQVESYNFNKRTTATIVYSSTGKTALLKIKSSKEESSATINISRNCVYSIYNM